MFVCVRGGEGGVYGAVSLCRDADGRRRERGKLLSLFPHSPPEGSIHSWDCEARGKLCYLKMRFRHNVIFCFELFFSPVHF